MRPQCLVYTITRAIEWGLRFAMGWRFVCHGTFSREPGELSLVNENPSIRLRRGSVGSQVIGEGRVRFRSRTAHAIHVTRVTPETGTRKGSPCNPKNPMNRVAGKFRASSLKRGDGATPRRLEPDQIAGSSWRPNSWPSLNRFCGCAAQPFAPKASPWTATAVRRALHPARIGARFPRGAGKGISVAQRM